MKALDVVNVAAVVLCGIGALAAAALGDAFLCIMNAGFVGFNATLLILRACEKTPSNGQ